MKVEATIIDNGKGAMLENGEKYPISKYQNNHGFADGTKVLVEIDNEYPDCGSWCDGDETCIACFVNNKVANIK